MNSLKAIMSRISSVPEAVSSLDEIGISVKDSSGEMREFDNIIDDLGQQWSDLSSEQQQNLGLQVAGRYQLSRFLILMERYEDATEAAATATNSSGSAMAENERYLDSYEAKIQLMKNAWTETTVEMQEAFLGDAIKGFTYMSTDAIKAMTTLVEKVGLLPPIFGLAGAGLSLFSKQFNTFIAKNFASEFSRISRETQATTIAMKHGETASRGYAAGMATVNVAGSMLSKTLKTLSRTLLPMAAFAVVGYGISKLTEKMTEARERAEKLDEEIKKFSDSNVDAVTDSFGEMKEMLDSYKDMGVNRPDEGFSDNDREQEYLNVQNELAEIFPAIVDSIDAKGQAHLKTSEEIDKEIEKAKELAKIEKNVRIADSEDEFDDILKDVKAVNKEIAELGGNLNRAEYWDAMSGFGGNILNAPAKWAEELLSGADFDSILENSDVYFEQKEAQLRMQASKLSDNVASIFDEMLYDLQDTAPEIDEAFHSIIDSIDFTEFNSEEIKEKTEELEKFARNLKNLFNQGDSAGFNVEAEELNSFLIDDLGLEKIDTLGFSYQSLTKEMDKSNKVAEISKDIHDENQESLMDEAEAADDLVDKQEKLAEVYGNSVSGIEEMNGFLNELDESGQLSANSIGTIMEKYQSFLPYLDDEVALREAVEDAIISETDTAEEAIMKQMMGNKEFFDYTMENNEGLYNYLSGLYTEDLDNFQSLAKAKGDTEQKIIKEIAGLWSNFYSVNANGLAEMNNEAINYIDGLGDTFKGTDIKMGGDFDTSKFIAQKEMSSQLNAINGDLKEMQSHFDSIDFNIDTDFDGLSSGISGAGKSAEEAGSKAQKSAKDTAEAYELSTYVADTYALALKEVEVAMNKQNAITSSHPKHSQAYRDSLQKEIDLIEEKTNLLNDQHSNLKKQIKSGNISETGVVGSGEYVYGNSGSGGSGSYSGKYSSQINRASSKHDVDPNLIASIIKHESNFNAKARSGAGAQGLMQLMPATARSLGVKNSYNPSQNIEGGTKYIAQQLKSFNGNIKKALAAYNAGPGNVRKYGGIPPFKETQNYVKRVMSSYESSDGSGGGGSSQTSKVASRYLNDFRVSSPYGMRNGRMHKGVDLSNGKSGSVIEAVRGGKVQTANYSNTAGNWVVVDQDDGTQAKYMHMKNTPDVKAGQQVSAGQKLGNVGNTGNSYGAHLHFQVEQGGKTIDPLEYLKNAKSDTSGNSAKMAADASKDAAQQLADIDSAKMDLLDLEDTINSQEQQIKSLKKELMQSVIEEVYYRYDKELGNLEQAFDRNEKYMERMDDGSKKHLKTMNKQVVNMTERALVTEDQRVELKKLHKSQELDSDQKDEINDRIKSLKLEYEDLKNSIIEYQEQIVDLKIDNIYDKYEEKLGKLEYRYEHNEKLLERVTEGTEDYGDTLRSQEKLLEKRSKLIYKERQELMKLVNDENISTNSRKDAMDKLNELSLSYQDLQNSIESVNMEYINSQLETHNRKIEEWRYNLERNQKLLEGMDTDDGLSEEYLDLQKEIIKATKIEAEMILAKREELMKLYLAEKPVGQQRREMEKQLNDLSLEYRDLINEIKNLKDEEVDSNKQVADDIIDTLKDAYRKKKEIEVAEIEDRIKRRQEDHDDAIEKIEEETNAYEESINKKIKAIDRQHSKETYDKDVDKRNKEIAKLQEEIDLLSLDDSYEAQAQRVKLEEELTEKKEELAEFQNDKDVELQKQSLQDQLEEYQKNQEDKRDEANEEFEKFEEDQRKEIEAVERKYDEILANDRKWAKMREDIIDGNLDEVKESLGEFYEYFEGINEETTEKLKTSFQEILNLIDDIEDAKDGLGDISTSEENTKKEVHGITTAVLASKEEALKLAKILEEDYGAKNANAYEKDGRWRVSGDFDDEERAQAVLDRIVELGYTPSGKLMNPENETFDVKSMAYQTEEEARKLADALISDYGAEDAYVSLENGAYRAYGVFDDFSRAQDVLKRVTELGYTEYGRVLKDAHEVKSMAFASKKEAQKLVDALKEDYGAQQAYVALEDGIWRAYGVFEEFSRAQDVLNRMMELGYTEYGRVLDEEESKNKQYEVNSGEYSSASEARKMADILKNDYGASNAGVSNKDGKWQAHGYFDSSERASDVIERMKELGYSTPDSSESREDDDTNDLYRLVTGKFKSRKSAENLAGVIEDDYGGQATRVQANDDGRYHVVSSFERQGRANDVLERLKELDYIKLGNVEKYHRGGIVGDKRSKSSEILNKLFNVKPSEQMVKSLKGELQIPPQNMPNITDNIRNLINSASSTPIVDGGVTVNGMNVHIDSLQGGEQGAKDLFKHIERKFVKKGGSL